MTRSNIIIAGAIVAALAGCATPAQRAALAIRAGVQQGAIDEKACLAELHSNPRYADIVGFFATPADHVTDTTYPTTEQRRKLQPYLSAAVKCRNALAKAWFKVEPGAAVAVNNATVRLVHLVAALADGRLTWGAMDQGILDAGAALMRELHAADERQDTVLREENMAEQAQRQAAGAALMNWSQQQQMIDQANRPWTASCTTWNGITTCSGR